MILGLLHRFLVDVNGFEKIALDKHTLSVHEIKDEENLICIQS